MQINRRIFTQAVTLSPLIANFRSTLSLPDQDALDVIAALQQSLDRETADAKQYGLYSDPHTESKLISQLNPNDRINSFHQHMDKLWANKEELYRLESIIRSDLARFTNFITKHNDFFYTSPAGKKLLLAVLRIKDFNKFNWSAPNWTKTDFIRFHIKHRAGLRDFLNFEREQNMQAQKPAETIKRSMHQA